MTKSTENKQCLVCGKPTENPKYCSWSCSAKATNCERPKRKPEGSCGLCGSPIPTKQRLCPNCQKGHEEESLENDQGVRSFRTLVGGVEKERVERIYVRQELVFDFLTPNSQLLDPAHPVCDLIQRLLGVLESQPAYVRPEDIPRFACLLRDLREFEIWVNDKGEKVQDRAGNLPIRCLDRILDRWVDHFFEGQFHPLLPTFALGLAQFMEPHVFEQTVESWEGTPWRITPLVRADDARRDGFPLLHDPRSKGEYTQGIKDLLVLFKIPSGGELYDPVKKRTVAGEGEEFWFVVLRGHLTYSTNFDCDELIAREANPPPVDLAWDFHLRGKLLPQVAEQQPPMTNAELMQRTPELEIPIHWITHAIPHGEFGDTEKRLPIPQWHV